RAYQRGGLLPMAVFLTQNAPGLRTSPVKRGYWVARRVLGEVIPPPPPVVPELPNDEAKLDLPLRDVLAQHRSNPLCAACHARFDAFGLTLENYGPVGETRTKELAGHAVDTPDAFPAGRQGNGLSGVHGHHGAGVTMCLPWLDSLSAVAATSSSAAFPKRFAVLFMGNGVNEDHWGAEGSGADMKLSLSLSPLEPLKNKINVINGLFNKNSTG